MLSGDQPDWKIKSQCQSPWMAELSQRFENLASLCSVRNLGNPMLNRKHHGVFWHLSFSGTEEDVSFFKKNI